ncbi:major facilitator superfamily domain-containing protein [Bisporella sp. PMI_857]|nr:major facilitator superfamily domain-containing protein [Bisporella sp. PMI_857]
MAYLLYKYIRKNRAARKNASTQSYEQQLSQDTSSPIQYSATASTEHGPELNGQPYESTPHSEKNTVIHEPGQDGTRAPKNEMSSLSQSQVKDERSKAEKKAVRKYRWKLVLGLFLPFAIQALETTVLAGAYPFIASDFNELSQLNWIVSAFNLCSAAFIPFWGQISDVFGRYAALQSALIIMIVGSALCAGAPVTDFPVLLVGRGLQGTGCAGLNIIVRTCLADKVSLQDNAKNSTIFTFVAGIAYGIGPVIGGYLTEVTWRWCFIINIPIGVTGMFLAHFMLRKELLGPMRIKRTDGIDELEKQQTFINRISTIDLGGQFLFLFGIGLLVLALTWGGSYYPWSHVSVIVTLIIGCVLIVAFFIWEYFMIPGHKLANSMPYRHAMIPLKLLWTRNAGIIIYINFITGMAMYAVFYFVDLYFTLVLEFGPSKAGTNIIYYLPGLGAGAYTAIFMCNVYPRQTWVPLFSGTLLEPLGITILAVALGSRNTSLIYGMLALTGVGTGIRFMPGTLHGVGYYPGHISSIVSLILLSVSLGGTFSMTIMLNIFNTRMSRNGISFTGNAGSFASIEQLPEQRQSYLREQAKESISLAFWAISAFLWLGCVLMIGLGNVDIRKKTVANGEDLDYATKGSYLGSLVRRRRVGRAQGSVAVI